MYQDKNFTLSGLEDTLFESLCKVKIPSTDLGKEIIVKLIIPDEQGDKQLEISKYFDRAKRLVPSIIVGHPTPVYIIDKPDIEIGHINALQTYHPFYQKMILKQVGLRIFQVICPTICYGGIGPKLKVIVPGVIEE